MEISVVNLNGKSEVKQEIKVFARFQYPMETQCLQIPNYYSSPKTLTIKFYMLD